MQESVGQRRFIVLREVERLVRHLRKKDQRLGLS
jgi:hypothetical protein